MAPPILDPRKRYLSSNRSSGVKHKVVNSKSELGKVHMKPSSDRSNHGLGVVGVHSPIQEVLRTSRPSVTRMNGSDFTSARLHPDRSSSRVQEEIWTIRPSNGCPISAGESWSVRAQHHLLRTELPSRLSKHHQTDQAWERSSDGSSNACTLTTYSHHGGGCPISARESWSVRAQHHLLRTELPSRLSKHHQTDHAWERSSDGSSNACKSLGRTTTGRGESVDNRGGRSAGSTNTRGDVSFGNTRISKLKSFKGRTLDGLDYSQQTVVTPTRKYEEYRRYCLNFGDRNNRWFFNLEYGHQKRCECNNCEHGGGSTLEAVARILGWCFDWVGGK